MISIVSSHEDDASLNSPGDTRLLATTHHQTPTQSAGKGMRLCHMCGHEFPKSSLPSHQRGCIRKSLSTPPTNSSLPSMRNSFSAGTEPSTHECGKCAQKVPLLKFAAHFRDCSSAAAADPHLVYDARASAPASRRRVPSLPRQTLSAQRANVFYYDESADASNSPAAVKRSVSNPIPTNSTLATARISSNSSMQDFKTLDSHSSIQEFNSSTRPPSRASVVSLSIAKKKAIPPPARQKQVVEREDPIPVDQVKKVPHPMYHENARVEQLDVSQYLIPCSICNRKFMQDRLDKHRAVCVKTTQKVRKVFDVRAARVQGTEMEKYVLKKPASEEPIKVKKSNWRAKHEAFRQMVVSARQPVQRGPGGSIIAAPASIPNPDYITCPCCERRFNEDSGKRHIPICKEKAAKKALERPSNSRGGGGVQAKDKLEELKRRTAYKPPTPKVKARR